MLWSFVYVCVVFAGVMIFFFRVLRKLMLGYQHSPDAFHGNLRRILGVLQHLFDVRE